MHKASQDPGNVRWFYFVPGQGRFHLPVGASGPDLDNLPAGTTRVFFGNELVWSRPVKSGAHLSVVR